MAKGFATGMAGTAVAAPLQYLIDDILFMTKSSRSFPLLTLWYKPGRTLQGLIASGEGHPAAVGIAALFGSVQSWRFYIAEDSMGLGVFAAGAVVGVLGIFLYAWLIRNFGRWFGASARQSELRTALGWGILPWTALFAMLPLLMAGASDAGELAGIYPFFFAAFVYGYIVLLLSLSAALRLSVLKTFLCLVITALVSIFPLTLIAQLIFGAPTPAP
jgi:hypothetical protein